MTPNQCASSDLYHETHSPPHGVSRAFYFLKVLLLTWKTESLAPLRPAEISMRTQEVAAAWSSGAPGTQTLLWPVPCNCQGRPGNHTHGGSCTLVVGPGALQGCRLDRGRAGDEGCDVENGGAHVEYHQLGGGGGQNGLKT